MASITGSDLRCRVEVLRRTAVTNALDETDYTYAPERKVWARIVPTSGSRKDVEGGVEQVEVTHRFTVRRGSRP